MKCEPEQTAQLVGPEGSRFSAQPDVFHIDLTNVASGRPVNSFWLCRDPANITFSCRQFARGGTEKT